ncbi:MAG TPA: hypothetical protein ENN41_08445, partial [Sediminispirochaeta sp.]|nr:hypothetical protein [Sediminispirochaeta sp.]
MSRPLPLVLFLLLSILSCREEEKTTRPEPEPPRSRETERSQDQSGRTLDFGEPIQAIPEESSPPPTAEAEQQRESFDLQRWKDFFNDLGRGKVFPEDPLIGELLV